MKNITKYSLGIMTALLASAFTLKADTIEDVDYFEAGGNYYCYPWLNATPPAQTPTPAGYEPFHLEHYGRHGSRWHIGNTNYDRPYEILKKAHEAGKLTPLGEQTFAAVCEIRDEFKKGRDGELSDKGAIQHQGIGKRMVANYPEIFTPETQIDAKSTVVIRSILSMFNALNGIQSLVPDIKIKTDASRSTMWYMDYDDPRMMEIEARVDSTQLKPFQRKHSNKGAYLQKLFNDADYARDSVGSALFNPLFALMVNTQSHYTQPQLTQDIFSIDEARERWKARNAYWFVMAGNSKLTENYMPLAQTNLLRNIIESADTAINSEKKSVNLRYGHDTVVMPLTCLLELNNYGEEINDLEELADKGWHDYKVVPMGANLQFVFYKPMGKSQLSDEDVLVKVLLNEEETTLPLGRDNGPYYKWSDFKNYYLNKISK